MSALLDLVLVTAAMVALLWGCGLLVARPLVPRRYEPVLPLFAPFLGLALISAVAHYAGAAGRSLATVGWLFVGLAAAGWAGVLLDPRLRRLPRSSVAALVICALAFLLAVAPLFVLGYLTTIGGTIDGISYATRSEYLQYAPPRLPDVEAGKPYLGWVRSQLELIRMGEVYLVGLLGLLTGKRSYELLTVVAALFFALVPGAVFVWARAGLRLGRAAALLAAALAGISNLLLWPVYDNFLSQTVALSFMPLLFWLGVEGQRRSGWRLAVLFGLLLATLASVYPVYTLHALVGVLGFWAAAWFLRLRGPRAPSTRRAALWWLGALATAVVANSPALGRAATELGFVSQLLVPSGVKSVGLGNVVVFPPVVEVFGIIAHAAAAYGEGWRRVPFPVLTVLGLAYAGLAVYGWWRLDRRARVAAAVLLLASAALAAQQRWGVNPPHGYPYGWFKIVSATTPQVLALLAAGIAALWRVRSGRWLAAGAALLLLALNLKHTLWTQSYVLEQRIVLDRELIEAGRAVSRLPPGFWALIDVTGLRQHWLGYLTRDRKIRYRQPLWTLHVATPGDTKAFFRYALVESKLDSQRQGEALGEPWYTRKRYRRLWSNRRYELRERRDSMLANLRWERPWPEGEPVDIALALERGALTVRLGQEQRETELAQAPPRTVQLHLYGLSPANRLEVPGTASPVSLAPGGWILDLDLGCVPGGRIAVRHAAGQALLAEIRVLAAATGRPGTCLERAPLRTGIAYLEQEVLGDGRIRLHSVVVRPQRAGERIYRLGFHIIDPAQQKLFGVWSLDFPTDESVQRGSLEIDLRNRSSRGEIGGRPAAPVTGSFDLAAGSFEGDAVWWQLNPVEQLLIEPMLWFQRTADGSVAVTRSVPAARLEVLSPP